MDSIERKPSVSIRHTPQNNKRPNYSHNRYSNRPAAAIKHSRGITLITVTSRHLATIITVRLRARNLVLNTPEDAQIRGLCSQSVGQQTHVIVYSVWRRRTPTQWPRVHFVQAANDRQDLSSDNCAIVGETMLMKIAKSLRRLSRVENTVSRSENSGGLEDYVSLIILQVCGLWLF